jgi:hypothetical protein
MAKQSKKIFLYIILAVVLTLLISAYFFYYLPKQNRTNEVNNYKKGLFESSLCQYHCPLTEQKINNVTQLLPEVNCVQNCSAGFKEKYGKGEIFSNADLEKDDLFKELFGFINTCKSESDYNITTNTFNTSKYFPCIAGEMENLRANYSYLN